MQWMRAEGYVGGRWQAGDQRFAVRNPATGEVLTEVSDLGPQAVADAIEAAERAGADWARRTAGERATILMRWRALILEHRDALARLLTAEQGKPLTEAAGEVGYGATFIEWFAAEGQRAYGRTIPTHQADKRLWTVKQPIGVTAAITPWNFPAAMIARKAAPALAAGCTFVVKPSEETPLSALALAALAEEAGIPPGVFSVVPGLNAAAIGQALCADPRVRKLSFTGSTAVGRILYRQSADTIKRLSLELGGNAPFVVFDDADIEAAVEGCIASKFRNAGQTCVCANRILVQSGVYGAFAETLAARAAEMTVGPGDAEGTVIGPLITDKALGKVDGLVRGARAAGARVVTGGGPHERGPRYYQPTVLAEVPGALPIERTEIFGPVAALVPFETEAEGVARANDTEYGLAAYFYSRDIARCYRVSEALESGMVGINTGMMSTTVAPFGGVKQSGIGREGAVEGLEEYVETKYIALGGMT